jgi:hypothetical protein
MCWSLDSAGCPHVTAMSWRSLAISINRVILLVNRS